MSGVTIDSQAEAYTNTGELHTHGYFTAPNGTSVTVTAAAIEGLTVGSGTSTTYTADGTAQRWECDFAPATGSWGLGTAVVAAVLLDSSNAQLATAQRIDTKVIPITP